MLKLNKKPHLIGELNDIHNELIPLKEIADRELASIYGLTGMVYTPHLDAYMQVCIKKAEILACLKRQNILPLSEVELISIALDNRYKRTKNRSNVEFEGAHYERRFLPFKLSKSGKMFKSGLGFGFCYFLMGRWTRTGKAKYGRFGQLIF